MPIPALPKRAAGPRRKKSAKELKPSTSTEESKEYFPEETHTTELKELISGDTPKDAYGSHEERVGTVDDLVSVPPSEAATPPPPSPSSVGLTEDDNEDEEDEEEASSPKKRPTLDIPEHDEEQLGEAGSNVMTPRPRSDSDDGYGSNSLIAAAGGLMQSDKKKDDEEEDEGEEETEEEEAARRQRIAEKMAHLGAVNPLSPGGFVSPVSPNSGKESAVVEEDDDKDESGKEEISKKVADMDMDMDTDKDTHDVAPSAGNESETNVPVLSPSALSQARDLTIQEHNESATSAKVDGGHEDESKFETPAGDEEEEDVDVDYPMMSPTAAAFGTTTYVPFSLNAIGIGRDDDAEPHGPGVAKTSVKHGDEPGQFCEFIRWKSCDLSESYRRRGGPNA
jgi:hypothetical protein